MKWRRQYEGPYSVTRILSPLTVEIQRSAKSRPKKVHVDKLKNLGLTDLPNFTGAPVFQAVPPASRLKLIRETLSPYFDEV